jgi:DNA-binding winged helix-turn-helix (wHTH) protein/dipeptidyl aminopeptidase/acylaminoacyl peptidase
MDRPRIKFGPFETALDTCELWKNGLRVKLGGQPFEILAALLEHPGELVTREELRKRIWSEDTFVDFSHSLNAAVNKLRAALCDSAEEPRYIETLPRRGYRFIGKTEVSEIAPQPAVAEHVKPAALEWRGNLVEYEWESRVPVKRQTLVQMWALLVLVALGAIGIASEWAGRSGFRKAPAVENAEAGLKMKLAAEQASGGNPAIWRLDIARAADVQAPKQILSAGAAIAGPQPSPDEKKLVYMSGSTDRSEIWVSNLDGSSPHKLTDMGRCGTPRWSPDSRWIAFDSDGRTGQAGIYVISPEGGQPQPVVVDEWNNMAPSWSRDGKWIYFASGRANDSEETEVWKVPFPGGQFVQVTRRGGFSGFESLDGQTLYYAKNRYEGPEIWQIPVEGGSERRVSSLLRPSTWANWALTRQGILFLSDSSEAVSTLEYFDFASSGVRPLGTMEKTSFWLSASNDGKTVWYSELTGEQARLVFRTGQF